MPFDLSTAKPEQQKTGGFDLSTAKIEDNNGTPPNDDISRNLDSNLLRSDSVTAGLEPQDTESSFLDEVVGVADAAGSIVSSAIAEPVAGLSGLASLLFTDAEQATKNIDAVRDYISVEPSSKEGRRNLNVVSDLVKNGVDLANIPVSGLVGIGELLSGQGLDAATGSIKKVQKDGFASVLGDQTFKATGSAELAAIAHALPTAALEVMGVKGLRSGKLNGERLSSNTAKAIQQAAPEFKALNEKKAAAYKELDEYGIKVKPKTFDSFADSLSAKLTKEGIDQTLTPKSSAALKRITESKGAPQSLSDLDTLRKIANGAASDINKADARLGNMIVREIDNGMDKLSNEIGGKFKSARGLAQRAFKSSDIQDMVEKATHTASGFENGLRQEARRILKNKKKRAGFSPDELSALRKIEQGTTLGNVAKFLGKFGLAEGGATSMLGASFGAGGGGVIGSFFGPSGAVAGAVTVPAIGQIAKATSQRITKSNTKFLDDLTRAGVNSKEITKAYLKNTPISDRSVSDLTDLLLQQDLTGGDVTSILKGKNTPTSKFLSDTMFFVDEINRRLKQTGSAALVAQPELDKEQTK